MLMQWTIQHSKTESPKIRAARKEKKLTLEQLAEDIGISVSQTREQSGARSYFAVWQISLAIVFAIWQYWPPQR